MPISQFLNLSDIREKTSTPIYYTTHSILYHGAIYKAFVLSLFFASNPGFLCCNFGYHPADVEHIVVLVDPQDETPKHVYFAAHGSGQGVWRTWSECEKTNNQKLVVYVSSGSNGMYPNRGRYWRIGGFANDLCDGRGKHWSPNENDFEDATNQSWSDSHFQVRRGINTPKNIAPPVNQSITSIERFLLFVPKVKEEVNKRPRLAWAAI